ncbi:MAG TPA: hypothetical protein VGL60_02710 [Acidimicrobiales bacterium]
MRIPEASRPVRCEALQLRLAETEEVLAAKEEEASVVLGALARSGDPAWAPRRREMADEAHREALRAAEHAARLREKVSGEPARPG